MTSFVKMTKLTNIVGRSGYISDPDRQENIIAKSPDVDWKPYQDFEKAHKRSGTKNNEGRELIIAIPNEWKNLPDLSERAEKLARLAVDKEGDIQWAIHQTKKGNNLHMHVIFSERDRLPDDPGKIYTRDVYHTADGQIARNKKDRAVDQDGRWLPPVHKKGDKRPSGFTNKDTKYKDKVWLHKRKDILKAELQLMGANLSLPLPFHQIHVGKGKHTAAREEYNEMIKLLNTKFLEVYVDTQDINVLNKIENTAKNELKQRRFPAIVKAAERWLVEVYEKARTSIDRMHGKYTPVQAIVEPVRTPEPPQPVPEPVRTPEPPQPVPEPVRASQPPPAPKPEPVRQLTLEDTAEAKNMFKIDKLLPEIELLYKKRKEISAVINAENKKILFSNKTLIETKKSERSEIVSKIKGKLEELKNAGVKLPEFKPGTRVPATWADFKEAAQDHRESLRKYCRSIEFRYKNPESLVGKYLILEKSNYINAPDKTAKILEIKGNLAVVETDDGRKGTVPLDKSTMDQIKDKPSIRDQLRKFPAADSLEKAIAQVEPRGKKTKKDDLEL